MNPSESESESESEFELMASTAFGLESVVRYELERLGYAAQIIGPGKLLFPGDARAIGRTNLWLRSADRVRIRVAHFPAADFDALFDATRSIDWSRWITPDGSIPVSGRSLKSQLTSVPAVQRTVKKGIVMSLQQALGVASLPETGPLFPVEIAIHEDQATLTLDTTGPSLHKRGYRETSGPAPLKETLAAALVQLSFWDAARPLIDPFCGTGTIPIEAALIGRNLAPGRNRTFAAEQWPWFRPEIWREAREEADELARPGLPVRLLGTDQDGRVLNQSRENATRAGVAEQIHFQQLPFDKLSSPHDHGCVIANPPYGQRMGREEDLQRLYESIPEVLHRFKTWSHFILTAFPQFEQLVERKADRRRKLYNGRIECTYYQFHGPKRPTDPGRARRANESRSNGETDEPVQRAPVFGGLTAKADEQAELFQSRLSKRSRHLRRWPRRRGITCYRLYERDIPEIPLVVDRYEDHLHLVEYERPHQRDRGQHAAWLELMRRTAAKTLEVPINHAFLKQRKRQRGSLQHERLDERRYEIVGREGGLQFWLNLSDYADTGLFLDHRITRDRVRQESSGARFLNLFSYTGAFSVYAANGGAAQTTSVDLSPTYQAWCRRNLELNELDLTQNRLVEADALSWLKGRPPHDRYDLAVVDAPTFSNSKRTGHVWDIQRGHAELLNLLLNHMCQGGVVYFASNYRRLKFSESEVEASSIREISRHTVPEDFRNQRVHRCWRLVR